MDLVEYGKERYDEIVAEYKREVLPNLPNRDLEITYLPISALEGDNVVSLSENTPWYKGQPLMELLDSLPVENDVLENAPFRLPVQYVNRPHLNFRGFAGTIAGGSVKVGDSITVLPSRKSSRVKSIVTPEVTQLRPRAQDESVESQQSAYAPMAVTLTLEDEIDISRGDMIVHSGAVPHVSQDFEVMTVWMNEAPMEIGENYIIKRATSVMNGSFTGVSYKKDINSFDELEADKLELNDIAKCSLHLDRAIASDPYEHNRFTGSFIIIDRYSNNTVGAGMIVQSIEGEEKAKRIYSEAERELNAYIRKHYPEWNCKKI
jgi:sulfate adenylyltransferase subunit 1